MIANKLEKSAEEFVRTATTFEEWEHLPEEWKKVLRNLLTTTFYVGASCGSQLCVDAPAHKVCAAAVELAHLKRSEGNPKQKATTTMDIAEFTLKEDALMNRIKAAMERSGKPSPLPKLLGERLWNWRFWIHDSVLYLHELKNVADDLDKKFPADVSQADLRRLRLISAYGDPVMTQAARADLPVDDTTHYAQEAGVHTKQR